MNGVLGICEPPPDRNSGPGRLEESKRAHCKKGDAKHPPLYIASETLEGRSKRKSIGDVPSESKRPIRKRQGKSEK